MPSARAPPQTGALPSKPLECTLADPGTASYPFGLRRQAHSLLLIAHGGGRPTATILLAATQNLMAAQL